MKGIAKALIAGGIVIGLGVILLIVALSMNGWKLKGNVDFEMTAYECSKENTNIDIEIKAGTVRTEFYDGDKIIIEYPVADGFKSLASEAYGKLTFKAPRKKWYKNWFFTYDIPESVIKLPKDMLYNVKVEIDAGKVALADGVYSDVEVDIDAGTVSVGNIICTNLHCDVDAGSVKIASAQCASFISNVSAGSVKVDSLTADNTDVLVKAGSVNLAFTGKEEDYNIQSSVKAGSCNLNSRTNADANAKWIRVKVKAGKIDASFKGN